MAKIKAAISGTINCYFLSMAEKTTKQQGDLKKSFDELKEIADWFESQQEVDVEAGLEKVKRGVLLIKECRERLSEVENEFEEIKKELD